MITVEEVNLYVKYYIEVYIKLKVKPMPFEEWQKQKNK